MVWYVGYGGGDEAAGRQWEGLSRDDCRGFPLVHYIKNTLYFMHERGSL